MLEQPAEVREKDMSQILAAIYIVLAYGIGIFTFLLPEYTMQKAEPGQSSEPDTLDLGLNSMCNLRGKAREKERNMMT